MPIDPNKKLIKIKGVIYEVPMRSPTANRGDEEPHYASEEETTRKSKPKWAVPAVGSLQARLLATVDRKSYDISKLEVGHQEKNTLDRIAQECQSLSVGRSKYPLEWIESKIAWATRERLNGKMINLKGLITAIQNEDALQNFLLRWEKQHGPLDPKTGGY